MSEESQSEKRKFERLQVDLPIQARMGDAAHVDLEMVDISASGISFSCYLVASVIALNLPKGNRLRENWCRVCAISGGAGPPADDGVD